MTKADLKPHREAVAEWLEAGARWDKVLPVWNDLARWAEGTMAVRLSGKPMCMVKAAVAENVARVAADVDPKQAVEVIGGMMLMRERDPRRFRSDDAFLVQLARRFRGLSDMNAGSFWDAAEGRVKRAYRDPSPRVSRLLGETLAKRLGVVGLYVRRAHEREEAARRNMLRGLAEEVAGHA